MRAAILGRCVMVPKRRRPHATECAAAKAVRERRERFEELGFAQR
jgi:hypothetical protein